MATQQLPGSIPDQRQPISPAQAAFAVRRQPGILDQFMNGLGQFLLNQWANLITIVLGLIVLIAISIPFLSYFGLDSVAKPLFYALHYVCAQIPSHSFYIFGHQLGLCARNFSIYTSMFLGSLFLC